MEAVWRKARRGRTVHAHPAHGVLDAPLCGATAAGPWFNGFPPPPGPAPPRPALPALPGDPSEVRMRAVVGTAGRAGDSDEVEVRLRAGALRFCRVLAADAPRVLAGHSAVLYSEEGEPVGDIAGSASGRMLVGASRAGRGFVPDGAAFPVGDAAFMVPRDHLRAHYHRHDGPVDVLEGA